MSKITREWPNGFGQSKRILQRQFDCDYNRCFIHLLAGY